MDYRSPKYSIVIRIYKKKGGYPMSIKDLLLTKISKFLLAAAPALAVDGLKCTIFFGEPKLPKKLKDIQ